MSVLPTSVRMLKIWDGLPRKFWTLDSHGGEKMKITIWKALAPLSLLLSASIASAAPASSVVEGQIFIITKGQQTFKLPLVRIIAVSEKDLNVTVAEKTRGDIAEARQLSEKIEQMKLALLELRSGLKGTNGTSLLDEIEQLSNVCAARVAMGMEAYERCTRTDAGLAAALRRKEMYDQYKTELAPILSARRELQELMKQHRALIAAISAQLNTQNLSGKYIDQTKSDADGKFSLTVPALQRVAIVADAQRAVGDNTERYQWIVLVAPKKGVKNSIFLANDNLLESGCDTCFRQLDLKTYPDLHGRPEFIPLSYVAR